MELRLTFTHDKVVEEGPYQGYYAVDNNEPLNKLTLRPRPVFPDPHHFLEVPYTLTTADDVVAAKQITHEEKEGGLVVAQRQGCRMFLHAPANAYVAAVVKKRSGGGGRGGGGAGSELGPGETIPFANAAAFDNYRSHLQQGDVLHFRRHPPTLILRGHGRRQKDPPVKFTDAHKAFPEKEFKRNKKAGATAWRCG